MKRGILTISILIWGTLSLSMAQTQKVYQCHYAEEVPYGVSAWRQSERVKKKIGAENRFISYGSDAAGGLSNDALVDRSSGEGTKSDSRTTTFYQAYNDQGWSIYIESKEPLIEQLKSELPDERSAARRESYELFFMPAIEVVPYYQLYIQPYINKFTVFDWAMPSTNYRSLKNGVEVESRALSDGIGTFVFIPWHLLYEHAPFQGGRWRFTLIRWMPFSKAGGVTWGGQVHETGRFGTVEFQPPTDAQRTAIHLNLLRKGWYDFLASAQRLTDYWSDEFIGDPGFYESSVKPEVERLQKMGEAWGKPESWGESVARDSDRALKELMELDYKVSSLREDYLKHQRLSGR